jgi:uncharacterized FlaG/YvyC family protein
MRIDPIQATAPDLSRSQANIQNFSSTPEAQLQQPEADSTVLAAVSVEAERQGNTREHAQTHAQVSYDEDGRAVVEYIKDSDGEVVIQVPSEQVLQVSKQIEKSIEGAREIDLRS